MGKLEIQKGKAWERGGSRKERQKKDTIALALLVEVLACQDNRVIDHFSAIAVPSIQRGVDMSGF